MSRSLGDPTFAILTTSETGFQPVLAESLATSLKYFGAKSAVMQGAARWLNNPSGNLSVKRRIADGIYRMNARRIVNRLKAFDAVIFVSNIPTAFLNSYFNDRWLRSCLPETPLILYQNYYLPTRGKWASYLKAGNVSLGIPSPGHFGIERYDWYLCTSTVSEDPFPRQPQRCSRIGLRLASPELFPQQQEFRALVDFPRDAHKEEREIVTSTLSKLRIPATTLQGHYPRHKIREIYRNTSCYFVAHRESFGVPICELQACGSLVFTPYNDWCPSHWLKDDIHVCGEGRLTENFRVYQNERSLLEEQLATAVRDWEPGIVRSRFLEEQAIFYWGDTTELARFVENVRFGRIHSKLHKTELSQ